jgi:[ribosomal protein S5]-alanine N-acetyltransferase
MNDAASIEFELIEIDEHGQLPETLTVPGEMSAAFQQLAQLHRSIGFVRPWIGYVAVLDQVVVGTCAFKSPPCDGRVEIAYFTLPSFEGRGIATEMARRLIAIAHSDANEPEVFAQTLPYENASTRILTRLGFTHLGTVQHPEDGEVWEWAILTTGSKSSSTRN